MTRGGTTVAAFTALLLAGPLAAQEETATPLAADSVYRDSLAAGATAVYSLALDTGLVAAGVVEQVDADVAIAIRGPDGAPIRRVDRRARGAERFQFEPVTPGVHRIEIRPAGDEGGRYTLALTYLEPRAADPADRADQLLMPYAGDDTPGAVVGVVRDGRLVFTRAVGMADLTHGIPFTVQTPTNIGSTSKQFTALAVAELARRGALSLDDDVRTHLPELPDFGDTITLRHLLTHTSGYREYLNTLALAGRRLDRGDHVAREEIVAMVRRQPALQNPPGAEWNYNNTGFALLTLVVERVTGQPFPRWMEENVFRPLGMHATTVRADPRQIVPGRARGYVPDREDGWREATDLGGAMGPGGIYTTVPNLAAWIANFRTGRVGGKDLLDRMTRRMVLATGDTTEYGLGVFVDEFRGLARVHHGGADVAHRSMLRYFPEIDAGVVALSNNATFNSGAVADSLALLFLNDAFPPEAAGDGEPATAFDPESYDPEDFDALAGRYALDAMPSFVLTFTREDDRLFIRATGQPQFEIFPTSDSTFALRVVQASVTFHRGPDGTADSLTLHQNGDHRARRIGAVWEPSAEELAAYAGRYYSDELETFYRIVLEGDSLFLRHRRIEEDVPLTPGREPDAFTGVFIAPMDLVFRRDEAGAVVGLEVSNGRTRGVRFQRAGPEASRSR